MNAAGPWMAVDVALGGEWTIARGWWSQQAVDQRAIADVAVHELVAAVRDEAQVFEVAGIGELVEVDDGFVVAASPARNWRR